jgi:DNA-binding GntR family transcriptional regulator
MTASPVVNGAGRKVSVVSRVICEIRSMVRTGELMPGQQVRQEQLALRLGVSRVPVREALKALESERVLRHSPHVGYAVARLTADELRQTYLMRRALETEVLLALPRLGTADLRALTEINDSIADEVVTGDVARIAAINHDFHFAVFRHSGLNIVVDEVERIWGMTEAYRSVHLYDAQSRKRVVREHKMMISALRQGDNARLVELMNTHRDITVADLNGAVLLRRDP